MSNYICIVLTVYHVSHMYFNMEVNKDIYKWCHATTANIVNDASAASTNIVNDASSASTNIVNDAMQLQQTL